jgi:hypothetical protein
VSGSRIVRTRRIEGRTTPAFIYNAGYFLHNLAVYEDGLVDCWELVDLPLFRKKLRNSWVSTEVPDGQHLHVHHLAGWTVAEGTWALDAGGLVDRIRELVRELNPRMENLYELREESGPYALGLPRAEPVRTERTGTHARLIFGERTWVLVRSDKVYLADLRAFADGSIELGHLPKPESLDLARLERAVRDGRVLSSVPPGTRIEIHGLGSFVAAEEHWSVKIQEVLRSVPDLIDSANGRRDSVGRCILAHEAYQADPTEQHYQSLQDAYEAVPEHCRPYVGSMETKDQPIRSILYGDEEDRS